MPLQENKDSMATIKTSSSPSSVFEPGNFPVKTIKVQKSDASSPPVDTLIVTPETKGDHPVLLFCHGYCTNNTWYSQILQHISSHGYIVVAPQFYQYLLISMNDETKTALQVTNWLSTGLSTSLPEHVKPNLTKLALSGHGRGGKTAFSLALRHTSSLKFKALFGIDPTSGPTPPVWLEHQVLSYVPHSFDISIPIGIIGTGLSNQFKGGLIPPLAPDGFNHSEFFNESKPPCCYFLARDYGICDVLDDSKVALAGLVCKSGKGEKEKMRRCVGGIVVSFLKAYLGGECEHLQSVVDFPSIAPVKLDPVIRISE